VCITRAATVARFELRVVVAYDISKQNLELIGCEKPSGTGMLSNPEREVVIIDAHSLVFRLVSGLFARAAPPETVLIFWIRPKI